MNPVHFRSSEHLTFYESINYTAVKISGQQLFIGKVLNSSHEKGTEVEVRNKFFRGEDIEILTPSGPVIKDKISRIMDHSGAYQEFVQPGSKVFVQISNQCLPGDLIRRGL